MTQPYPNIDASPNFAKLEEEILAFWQAEGVFEQSVNQRAGAADYVFYDGPPFANGLPHYGHLLTGYVKDAIARYHTMRGKRVERRFGWDCHGLPAEMGAEKELGISGRAAIAEYGIGKFNEHCRTSVMKYTADWEYYVNRQGRWVDFANDYKTMDTPFMESCLWAFKELWNKGLIYESMRVMPYSWAAETPVSNFETRMDNATRPREDLSAYVKFRLKEKPAGAPEADAYYVIAWTTTPWTLPSNLALAVNAGMEYAVLREVPPPACGGRLGGGQRLLSMREPDAQEKARALRKDTTDVEKKLWQLLRGKQLEGYKFRRQEPFGSYIVDFICHEASLIIELDGGQHAEQSAYDRARSKALESEGFKVLRFWNNEIVENLEGVLTTIVSALNTPLPTSPRKQGEGPLYFVATSAAAKLAENLKAEIVGNVQGTTLINLSYEPLFPYFADTKNAFKVLDGSAFVTDGDGTGIVHMAPGFGEVDQQACAENGIEVMVPVDEKGRFAADIFDLPDLQLQGLTVVPDTRIAEADIAVSEEDAARHIAAKDVAKYGLANMRIVRWLKANHMLVKSEPYSHNYPHCWRTDTPLIYRAMSSWYVNVQKIKANMVENNQTIHWIPDHVQAGQMGKGIETAPDWSISRNRFWGTPIPIWVRQDSGFSGQDSVKVFGSIAEMEDFFDLDACFDRPNARITDLHRPFIDQLTIAKDGTRWRRIEDVFDCWFESGSMPFAQLHYPFENKQQFEKNFPADFITEYIAQTRGWFYTLQVLSAALFGKAPFKNVICHGVVIDEETGLKYSKRLKNYRDPKEVMDEYGADALRWMMLSSPVMRGSDLGVDPDGKFIRDVVRLNIKPMWSAYYFFTLYANADGVKVESRVESRESSQNLLDRYILAKARAMVEQVRDSLDAYDTPGAAEAVTAFLDVLNNWYIRRSRARFWGEGVSADKQAAFDTLFTVLTLMCRAAAPLLPFTTEAIYRGLHAASPQSVASVHLADFPDVSRIMEDAQLVADMDRVRDACTAMASVRSSANIRNRQPLASATYFGEGAEKISKFSEILKEEANVKNLIFKDSFLGIAKSKLTINFPEAGKRLKENMKEIAAAAKANNWVVRDGKIMVGNDLLFELRDNEYKLELVPMYPHLAQALSTNDAVVELDLTITPALEAEGHARDMVRMVQQARKDAGLQVSDRIALSLVVTEHLRAALDQFGDYIAEQTLAVSLSHDPLAAHSFASTQEIEGDSVTIQLAKAA